MRKISIFVGFIVAAFSMAASAGEIETDFGNIQKSALNQALSQRLQRQVEVGDPSVGFWSTTVFGGPNLGLYKNRIDLTVDQKFNFDCAFMVDLRNGVQIGRCEPVGDTAALLDGSFAIPLDEVGVHVERMKPVNQ